MSERGRAAPARLRRAVAIGAIALVALPAFTGRDSTPLSTYPMYAFVRDRDDRFQTVLAEGDLGELRPVSLRMVADTDDPLIAQSLVADAIASGRAAPLCERVAARIGTAAHRVLVVDEVHDVIALARGRPSLRNRVVHAACEVAP